MARLRYNGLTATLGAALTSGGTTITFAAPLAHSGGTAVPTITGTDYIPLTIFTSAGAVSEIVSLTAYTTGATTGTIARAQESTTATAHASGAAVVHAPTAADFAPSGSTPQICLLSKNAAQGVPGSTWTALTFDVEESDVLNMHSTSSNTSRITVPAAGFYLVTSTAVLSASTRAYLQFAVNGTRKNGRNLVNPGGAVPGNGELVRVLQLAAGDYLETFIYLLDGGADVAGNASYSDDTTTFSIAYMSGV